MATLLDLMPQLLVRLCQSCGTAFPYRSSRRASSTERLVAKNKKADVVEHPEASHDVGLLFNEPLGRAELFFI
jgi:hypothetical protein